MAPPPPDGSNYGGARRRTFYETIAAAVQDIEAHGFDSMERVEHWMRLIREAALAEMRPIEEVSRQINESLAGIYRRQVERGGILKMHPGVAPFTLQQVQPKLHAELRRRQMASANQIRLNRAAMIEKTDQRFSGWATSIPAGGSDAVDKVEVKTSLRKALAQLPFEERRVAIDQGAKFSSNLSNILAVEGGAIAGVWESHYRQAGYHYRPDHKARDGNVYAIRGNWAVGKGLMKCGPAGYTDEITAPGEEIFCRCKLKYLYALRALPSDMRTAKGDDELERVKAAA